MGLMGFPTSVKAAGAVEVGAMTHQRDIEVSDLTRNRGTIGGSLCHLDPAAEIVLVAGVHDATMVVEGPNGRREIPFLAFPVAFMTPSIEPDEIVTAIRFPLWAAGHRTAFVEFARRHRDFAIVSAAVC